MPVGVEQKWATYLPKLGVIGRDRVKQFEQLVPQQKIRKRVSSICWCYWKGQDWIFYTSFFWDSGRKSVLSHLKFPNHISNELKIGLLISSILFLNFSIIIWGCFNNMYGSGLLQRLPAPIWFLVLEKKRGSILYHWHRFQILMLSPGYWGRDAVDHMWYIKCYTGRKSVIVKPLCLSLDAP